MKISFYGKMTDHEYQHEIPDIANIRTKLRAPLKISLRQSNLVGSSKSRSEKWPILLVLAALNDELLRRIKANLSVKKFLEVPLRLKHSITASTIAELGADMRFAHPINPNSSFAQELREEFARGEERGIERGLALDKIDVIQGLLKKGFDWSLIFDVTHVDQAGFEELKSKFGQL